MNFFYCFKLRFLTHEHLCINAAAYWCVQFLNFLVWLLFKYGRGFIRGLLTVEIHFKLMITATARSIHDSLKSVGSALPLFSHSQLHRPGASNVSLVGS